MVKFCGIDISHTFSVTNDRKMTQKQITTIMKITIVKEEKVGEFIGSYSREG